MITSTDLRNCSSQFRERQGIAAIIRKLNTKIELAEKYQNVPLTECINAKRLIIELKKLLNQLDNNKIIQPPPEIQRLLAKPRKDLYTEIMPSSPEGEATKYSVMEQAAIDLLATKALDARAQALKFELYAEINLAAYEKSYMVFDTLTCRDDLLHEVFYEKSWYFQNYLRRYRRMQTRNGGDHKYFAVVERGGKTGRLHLHVLHILNAMPFSDPNANSSLPYRRQIEGLRNYWEAGFCQPIAVRHKGDAYTAINWRWPTDRKGIGIPLKEPSATGAYIMKYVAKAYTDEQRKEYPWRVRKSKSFGRTLVRRAMEKMTDTNLVALMLTQKKVMAGARVLPKNVLYQEAFRTLSNRWNLNGSLGKLVATWQSQDTPLTHLRNSTQPKPDLNLQSIMSFMIQNSLVTDDFNVIDETRIARRNFEDEIGKYFYTLRTPTTPGRQTTAGAM